MFGWETDGAEQKSLEAQHVCVEMHKSIGQQGSWAGFAADSVKMKHRIQDLEQEDA